MTLKQFGGRPILKALWEKRQCLPYRLFRVSSIVGITAVFAAGCIGNCETSERRTNRSLVTTNRVPILLPFNEFRSGVYWGEPQAIQVNGKIVVYQNYLLVNEPDKGVHIFDNTDPESPENLGFLTIPGNHDFVVKDDILYANSYTDLVLVGISDTENVEEVGRQALAFRANFDYTDEAVILGYEYQTISNSNNPDDTNSDDTFITSRSSCTRGIL